MPHFNFKNIKEESVKKLSIEKTKELAETFGCPENDITYDVVNNTSILQGDVVLGDKTIVVQMFERDQKVKDGIATILEAYFNETTIIFQIIEPHNYYEHGKNFS